VAGGAALAPKLIVFHQVRGRVDRETASRRSGAVNPDTFLVRPDADVRLARHDPSAHPGLDSEADAESYTKEQAERLTRLQRMLHAHETYGVLIILQGMDAAGKDETIQEVFSSLDPQVCQAVQFKEPTRTEAGHDFLWRAVQALPSRGQIRIFNRSYYEQVTSERVYPELTDDWGLPPEAREDLWEKRYRQINDFERHLAENGFLVLKFFLHVSKETERERLLERATDHDQQWDFSETDLNHYNDWDALHETFEEMLGKTSTAWAPWYVIPADSRWYTYAAVASVLVERLGALHEDFPDVDDDDRRVLEKAREVLEPDGE
jgi:PPK2 family polyphosphate:nucleotide phosphotransferase